MNEPSNYPRPLPQAEKARSGTRLDAILAAVRAVTLIVSLAPTVPYLFSEDRVYQGTAVGMIGVALVLLALLIPAANGRRWAFAFWTLTICLQGYGVWSALRDGNPLAMTPLGAVTALYDLFYVGYCATRFFGHGGKTR